jgi:hypothetical protein
MTPETAKQLYKCKQRHDALAIPGMWGCHGLVIKPIACIHLLLIMLAAALRWRADVLLASWRRALLHGVG